jgi:ABC-type nitrate/sulfonate/bicarbonate transport system permease component
MGELIKRLLPVIVIILIISWELLYVFRFIDPARISHPIAICLVMADFTFSSSFLSMLVQAALLAVIGGAIGLLVAICANMHPLYSRPFATFLRAAMWLPFFTLCAVSEWAVRSVSFVTFMGLTAMSGYSGYLLLLIHITGTEWMPERLRSVGKLVLLQALLFALYSQIHLHSSWIFLIAERPELSYAAVLLLGLVVFIIQWTFRFDFDTEARNHCRILIYNLNQRRRVSLVKLLLLVCSYLVGWYALTEIVSQYLSISNLVAASEQGYHVLFTVIMAESQYVARTLETADLGVSVFEIFVGLAAASGTSVLICNWMNADVNWRRRITRLLPLTYLAPFVLSFSVSNWFLGSLEVWRPTFGIGLLTFYPLIKVMWGLGGQHKWWQILLAVREALPFAFVAMIVGEIWGATKGLGFLAVVARSEMRTEFALLVGLFTFVLFLLFSAALDATVKRLQSREVINMTPGDSL